MNFARLLEEEFQKREELERLKQQQEEMLRAEREQKAELEVDKKEQERILQEAKAKLEQLERERAAAAEKMQVIRTWNSSSISFQNLFTFYVYFSFSFLLWMNDVVDEI